jgi:signal transduction histidine kinase
MVLVLAIGAVVFSNSFAARRVANDAQQLDLAESTLAATDLAVKAFSQALLLAEDESLGVADAETARRAFDEAQSVADELEIRSTDLVGTAGNKDQALRKSVDLAVAAATQMLQLLEQGDIVEANALLSGDGLAAFEGLRDAVLDVRDEAAAEVTSTSDLAGKTSFIATFLVAFLIPAGAILVYRRVAQSQLRLAEVELDSRIEAEQRITHAKDEFIANISHELRTPLTSIYGMSDALLEQGIVDPQLATEFVGIINTEATELGRMVEDLLTSARSETQSIAFEPDHVDIAEELEVVLAPLRRSGLDVEVELESTQAWADRMRVRQILRNLVSNASKHGGPGVSITARQRSQMLEITVSDDGPGVPADKEPLLFTKFVHKGEDPLTAGSVGLGLAVVNLLADGMGGDARYIREEGWSRFVVRLPVDESGASVGTSAWADSPRSVAVAASSTLSDHAPGVIDTSFRQRLG